MDALTEKMNDQRFRVAIFGSARINEGSPEYALVYDLARLIASAEMDLVTGGGPGLMEAASNGYFVAKRETSQQSIGLNIRLPQGQRVAKHLDVKREFEHFSERLDNFVALSNAFVVTPGGIGTTLELFYTWQLAQVKEICDKPIILLGEMWFGLMEWIRNWPLKKRLLEEGDMGLIYVTHNCSEAFTIIQESYRHYSEGGTDFCRQYQQYRLT
jgi:uncharacterized protein (TIGR00730 family)